MNKTAIVMCFANPSNNPRPNRIIKFLHKKNIIVDTISFKSDGDLPIRQEYVVHVSHKIMPRLCRAFIKIIRKLIPNLEFKIFLTNLMLGISRLKIKLNEYDLIIVENIEFLPFAIKNKGTKTKILCDLREFYPLEFSTYLIFNVFEQNFKYQLCKKYLPLCDELITVCEGLAEKYESWFNLKPKVIMSTPYYTQLDPTIPKKDIIKMVHHGAAQKDRKLENMIHIFKFLDKRFFLDFYLVGDKNYINYLTKLAKPYTQIRILPPIPFNQIIPIINQYDIGLYILEEISVNTTYSLPNKFFEYVQSRLMIVIGPSPEMAKLTKQHNLGIISNSFNPKDIAQTLNSLSCEDIYQYKLNANKAAKELCYETESQKLDLILTSLLKKKT